MPAPVDIWTVHAYLLPEDGGQEEGAAASWGIGVPPGLTARAGGPVPLRRHSDDLQLFAEQLITMRRWPPRLPGNATLSDRVWHPALATARLLIANGCATFSRRHGLSATGARCSHRLSRRREPAGATVGLV
ncbi:MAG: hypothetical protein R2867_17145 [Caldilineaceae bacterium]